MRLIMAGGYDLLNQENIDYLKELKTLAVTLGLKELTNECSGSLEDDGGVLFLRSPSDAKKTELLIRSGLLLYTPSREHFGIVPVEAMYCGLPVLAVNSGGPPESLKDGGTGFLVGATAEGLCVGLFTLSDSENERLRTSMSEAGRKRVKNAFSFDAFSSELDRIVRETHSSD